MEESKTLRSRKNRISYKICTKICDSKLFYYILSEDSFREKFK